MLSFMNDDSMCINYGAWFNASNLLLQQVLTEPISKKKKFMLFFVLKLIKRFYKAISCYESERHMLNYWFNYHFHILSKSC